MDSETAKQLRIKHGVCSRAMKELDMYNKEVTEGESKLGGMAPTEDKYRQLQQALEESKTMLEDAKQRSADAKEDLEMFWDSNGLKDIDSDDDLVQKCKELLGL